MSVAESGRHPRSVVAVAAVLAQEVTQMPDGSERIVGDVERGDARGEVATVDR
jgi:hypothetical protein